ncbi:unnamed protein product [Fusarium graminearum]|nr:unnamed protein product [Fusarium graminearum]CAG1989181.1 unnamed protein product [Fusarium graminearum]
MRLDQDGDSVFLLPPNFENQVEFVTGQMGGGAADALEKQVSTESGLGCAVTTNVNWESQTVETACITPFPAVGFQMGVSKGTGWAQMRPQ